MAFPGLVLMYRLKIHEQGVATPGQLNSAVFRGLFCKQRCSFFGS